MIGINNDNEIIIDYFLLNGENFICKILSVKFQDLKIILPVMIFFGHLLIRTISKRHIYNDTFKATITLEIFLENLVISFILSLQPTKVSIIRKKRKRNIFIVAKFIL